VLGAPDAGRLVQIDNGYGAQTTITYSSAKADTSTLHQLPFPEIVVSSIKTTGTQNLGGSLSEKRYAYGDGELIFDPVRDAFVFPGYREKVELLVPSSSTEKGTATVTTAYGLASATAGMTQNERFGRYLRAGLVRDVSTLTDHAPFEGHPSGSPLGTDPQALLGAFHSYNSAFSADIRVFASTHHEWDTRLLPRTFFGTGEFCVDMVLPYDDAGSIAYDKGQGSDAAHADFDLCEAHAFAYESSVQNKRVDAISTASDASAITRTEVRSIDDFGRISSVAQLNDFNRSDDDLCVNTIYAAPTGSNERVLNAPASRTITDCTMPTAKVLSKDSWTYDKLAAGKVSNGFVTGHDVERHDESGALLGTVHTFDATYNSAGNLNTVTTTREDTATQTVTLIYDAFQLVLTSQKIDAKNADGTALPALTTAITSDQVTLNPTVVQDPNGTWRRATYDGFGRTLISFVTPPGGNNGALSSTTYNGFAVGQTGGRNIFRKVFTDPVALQAVSSTVGRQSTVFLDELGRAFKTEVNLGADYTNKKLTVGQRTYDGFGRVLFEADPFRSTDSFASAYGTTRYFNGDGSPNCFVRGAGLQTLTSVTNEASEIYPTCFSHGFLNNEEYVFAQLPDSLLRGSPQEGVGKESDYTASGRLIRRETWGWDASTNPVQIEKATFGYDALGHLTNMTRYQDAAAGANPVSSSSHYDSLGWLLEFDEPPSAPQFRSYDSWGELTQTQWCDNGSIAPCPTSDRRSILKYDALGRVIHSEDQTMNVVDAATVNDYTYDKPVTISTPQTTLTTTNVLGRLVQATSPTSAIALSYDTLGRINAKAFTDTTVTPATVYLEKHDIHGDGSEQTLHLQLPDTLFKDEKIDYAYDSAGRVRSVKYNDGTNQDLFTTAGSTGIDVFGRIRQAQYGLATYTADYADSGRRLLNSVRVAAGIHSREIDFQGTGTSARAFDPVGRERSRRELTDGDTLAATHVSSYDELGELTSATRSNPTATLSSAQFTYDALGNLKTADLGANGPGNATLSYQSVDRDRICSISYTSAPPAASCNVQYDGSGSIVQQPQPRHGQRTRQLSYFPSGRVKQIINATSADGTDIATFNYDAFGAVQRLTLTSDKSPDTRHDKHFGGLISQRDERISNVTQSVVTRTIPAPGLTATRHGPGGPWTFAFGESRGNRFVTDQNGAFVQDMDYQPYGELMPPTVALLGTNPGTQLYTSEQWNSGDALAAFGLSQLGARIYDPVIGRFLSRDPLIIPRTAATTNPYAFANNDPVNRSDPSGLMISTGTYPVPSQCPAEGCVAIPSDPTTGAGAGGVPDAISGGDGSDDGAGEPDTQSNGGGKPIVIRVPIGVHGGSVGEQGENDGGDRGRGGSGGGGGGGRVAGGARLDRVDVRQVFAGGRFVPPLALPPDETDDDNEASDDTGGIDPAAGASRGGRGGQGKGERGRSAKTDGNPNPGKYAKPDPNRPGEWIKKDPHTGRWSPAQKGWKPNQRAAVNAAVGVGTGYLIYRAVRFIPSLFPPLWWTIPENAAIP